jgi:hypothetical protein
MSKYLFREESMQRISSPEKLDEYLKILNPSVWVMLGAVMAFFLAFFVWGLTGSVRDVCPTKGIWLEDTLTCYVEPQYGMEIKEGMRVVFINGEAEGIVSSVTLEPVTRATVEKEIGNAFFAAQLDIHDWNMCVTIATNQISESPELQAVDIIISEFIPLEFFLGRTS